MHTFDYSILLDWVDRIIKNTGSIFFSLELIGILTSLTKPAEGTNLGRQRASARSWELCLRS